MDKIKALAEQYTHQVWNVKDIGAVERHIHPHCVIHSLLGPCLGIEAMTNVIQTWHSAFPDLLVTMEATLADKDSVIIRWNAKGTHLGMFKGQKGSGLTIFYSGVTIYRFYEEKIIEYWAYLDMDHLLKQITGKLQ